MRSHRFYCLSCWCLVVFINQIQAVRITAIEDACVARDTTLTAKLEDIPRGQRASPLPSGSTSRPCATNSRVLTNIETLNDCGCSGNHLRGGFPGNNHLRGFNNLLANKQACRGPQSANHKLAHPGPFAAPPQKDGWVGHHSDHAEPYHPRGAEFSQKINLNPGAEPFIPRSTRQDSNQMHAIDAGNAHENKDNERYDPLAANEDNLLGVKRVIEIFYNRSLKEKERAIKEYIETMRTKRAEGVLEGSNDEDNGEKSQSAPDPKYIKTIERGIQQEPYSDMMNQKSPMHSLGSNENTLSTKPHDEETISGPKTQSMAVKNRAKEIALSIPNISEQELTIGKLTTGSFMGEEKASNGDAMGKSFFNKNPVEISQQTMIKESPTPSLSIDSEQAVTASSPKEPLETVEISSKKKKKSKKKEKLVMEGSSTGKEKNPNEKSSPFSENIMPIKAREDQKNSLSFPSNDKQKNKNSGRVSSQVERTPKYLSTDEKDLKDPPKQKEKWIQKETQPLLDSSNKAKKNYPFSETHQIHPSITKTLAEETSPKNHETDFQVASTSIPQINNIDIDKLEKNEATEIALSFASNYKQKNNNSGGVSTEVVRNPKYISTDENSLKYPPNKKKVWIKKETQLFLDSSNEVEKNYPFSKTHQINPSIEKTLAEETSAKNHKFNLLVDPNSSPKIKKMDIEKVQKNQAAEKASSFTSNDKQKDKNSGGVSTKFERVPKYISTDENALKDTPNPTEEHIKKEAQVLLHSSNKVNKNYPFSKTPNIKPSIEKTSAEETPATNHESNFLVASTSIHKIKNMDIAKVQKNEASKIESNDPKNIFSTSAETQDNNQDEIKTYVVPEDPKSDKPGSKTTTQTTLFNSSNILSEFSKFWGCLKINSSSSVLLKFRNLIENKKKVSKGFKSGDSVDNNENQQTTERERSGSLHAPYFTRSALEDVIDGMQYVTTEYPPQEAAKSSKSVNNKIINNVGKMKLTEVFGLVDSKSKSKSLLKYLNPVRVGRLLENFSDNDIGLLSDASLKNIVSDWKKMNLPKWPMFLFAHHLKLANRNLHVPLELDLSDEGYHLLLHVWSQGHHQFEKLEIESSKFIDGFEFKRRLHAFRHLLHSHTLAARWANWRQSSKIESRYLDYFESNFKVSTNYLKIDRIPHYIGPILYYHCLHWDRLHPKMKVQDIFQSALGNYEAQKRQELYDYFINRKRFRKVWWDSRKLEQDRKKYGLDILVILNVGDALQFDTKNFDLSRTLNSCHKKMIQIMTDKSGPFPWLESPERAWIYRNHGELYVKRLKYLQRLICKFSGQDRQLLITKIIPFLAHEIGTGILESPIYQIGYELTWCDMGFKLEDLKEFWLARNHKGDPLKMAKFFKLIKKFSMKERKALAEWHSKFVLDDADSKNNHIKQTIGSKFVNLFSKFFLK